MPPEPPFTQCCATELGVCAVGIKHAIKRWLLVRWRFPTVLWVHGDNMEQARRALAYLPMPLRWWLTPHAHPDYQPEWWSVGSHTDMGFGSKYD